MDKIKNISAKITGIKYDPLICRKLSSFSINDISEALSKRATFILKVDEENQFATSWWVSAKRTRSYPYARVYDSLDFSGKKITIIPILKDEGKEGDRDFLQWDTISLMSLLGVYVIISYYKDASLSSRYKHKITNQRFDIDQIKPEIDKLLSYQSDALHWNLEQIEKVGEIGRKALESYEKISRNLNVDMHSEILAKNRIDKLIEGKEIFMKLSRELAQKAQQREGITLQPKEKIDGTKAIITIQNYLGGYYYFTSDEIRIDEDNIYLIEAKHTKGNKLPSIGDIKDGLIKMILFSNLKEVEIDNQAYNPIPVLKLTTGENFDINKLNKFDKKILELLKKEAKKNNFKILINKDFLN
jgi:hypothetical protein